MRIHIGAIPDEFTPDSSWRPLREPGPVVMQILAVPVGFGMAALIGFCWLHVGLTMSVQAEGAGAIAFLFYAILSFLPLIAVHEFLHAVVHPCFGCSQATVIGVWPQRLLFYALYSGPLPRNRLLAVFAMPFLIITVLPLVLAAVGILPPGLAPVAAWFSTWNALFACGDYFGLALIFAQIPRAAIVQNQSWRTYWKPT